MLSELDKIEICRASLPRPARLYSAGPFLRNLAPSRAVGYSGICELCGVVGSRPSRARGRLADGAGRQLIGSGPPVVTHATPVRRDHGPIGADGDG